MTPAATIRITRGLGGEVEVEGVFEDLAKAILIRAGFFIQPTLRGHWIRLPFDMGRTWENSHATWAAQMLEAARFPVELDEDLRAREPGRPLGPATMTAQTPPGRRHR
ncbi:hypothetical protein [Streptomyces sp. NPDC005004]